MTVLSTSVSMYHVGAVPTVVKRGHQIPLELGLQWLQTTMWVQGTEPGFSATAASLLTMEPCLQSLAFCI